MKRNHKILVLTLCFLLTIPAASASAATYTVTSNDSLYSVGQLFKTSSTFLKASNNFDTNSFSSGDKIFVPSHLHKVQSGESLYKIATRYGIPVTNLKKANGLTSNSVTVGKKLMIPGVKPYRSTDNIIPYSTGEVDLLARLIEAEAAGESLKAKVTVGAVVINRVQSGEWASTIKGVIYQKYGEYYQFTPVKNGMINNTPSADSKRAAWIAMFGSDPSNGAIYYFDTSSTNQWLWSKTQTAKIDTLVFAK